MFRNRNGYWMTPKFFMHYAEDSGGGSGGADGAGTTGGEAGNSATDGADGAGNDGESANDDGKSTDALQAEIDRLNAELAKQKAATDKATHEASVANKALKAKMTQEEIAANEKKEAEEAQKNRIIELEKMVAKTNTVKAVMGKLGIDEAAAGNLADHLYGAADIDNALLEIQKAWQSKEAALRKEFGKVTGPGAGADSNSPEAQGVQRAIAIGKNQKAVNEQAQKAMQAYIR